ncbi:MAG: hypothetical protein ACI8UO_003170 [Verrucomicrobiales bacterium]|jgi:hypothetical protein
MSNPSAFVHLDPFVAAAVGEMTIWGENGSHFRDVSAVHGGAYDGLSADIDAVRLDPMHNTRVRFLIGSAGSGKSHLFSRLRRRTGSEAAFTFVANPPTHAEAIIPTILERVIHGLRRPVIRNGESLPYSQLRESMFALLHAEGLLEEDSHEAHDYWEALDLEEKRDFMAEILDYLVRKRQYDESLIQVLLHVLDDELERVALRWLSGSSNLSDAELESIGQREPLDEEGAYKLLQRLGSITAPSNRPIILVLDQLDEMVEPSHIAQFERLLTGLTDGSQNWLVIISLIQNKFGIWQEKLSAATKSRLAAPGPNEALPIIELMAVTDPEQKREIVRSRLNTPGLMTARAEQEIHDPLFPLAAADIDELAAGEPVYPRKLLRMAREIYHKRCESSATGARPISDLIEALFLDARAEISELPEPNTSFLADRIREAIAAGCKARKLGIPAVQDGPLQRSGKARGTDRIYELDDQKLRILGHDRHGGRAFPEFMKQAVEADAGSLLVRDGRVPVRGKAGQELLEEYELTGIFLHLTEGEIRDLHALGKVMADLREGALSDLQSTPPPTADLVIEALGKLAKVAKHRVVTQALRVLHPGPVQPPRPALSPIIGSRAERPAAAANGDSKLPSETSLPIAVPAPEGLVEAVTEVLRAEQWVSLERLQHRLQKDSGRPVALAQLRNVLDSPPLSEHLSCYPDDLSRKTDVHILIWNESA